MNELYGIAPNALQTPLELRALLLHSFGPQAGRYIMAYPSEDGWCKLVIENFDSLRDIQKEQVKAIVRRAKEKGLLCDPDSYTWQHDIEWVANVLKKWRKTENYKKIFVAEGDFERLKCAEGLQGDQPLCKVDDADLSSSTERFIPATPDSYWSVCSILCRKSDELHFVDPYFDPLGSRRKDIFQKFVSELAGLRKVRKVCFWISCRGVKVFDRSRIESLIRSSIKAAVDRRLSIEVIQVDDTDSKDRLHDRFLLTGWGGIVFGQGFEKIMNDGRNRVSPMGGTWQEEWDRFSRRNFDFRVVNTAQFVSGSPRR